MSSAECLMHGAAHALQRATPRPTPPRPAVNVDVDAHSVVPSTQETRAGAYEEVDVVNDGSTPPAASQPLNGLHPLLVVVMSTQGVQVPILVLLMIAFAPALKVVARAPVPRATCSQCTTMLMTSPLFSPFRMPLLVAAVTAKIVMVLIVVLPRLVCTMTHRVTMMTTTRRTSSKQSLAVWASARTRATTIMGWMSV